MGLFSDCRTAESSRENQLSEPYQSGLRAGHEINTTLVVLVFGLCQVRRKVIHLSINRSILLDIISEVRDLQWSHSFFSGQFWLVAAGFVPIEMPQRSIFPPYHLIAT